MNRRDDWDYSSWDQPINQVQLAGTLMLFSLANLAGCQAMGMRFSDRERDAVFHLWRYVGLLMGLHPELVPTSEDDTWRLFWLEADTEFLPDDDSRKLAQALHSRFAPGEAATTALPPVGHGAAALRPAPCENSPAGRQAAHPLLQEVAKAFGRGPLWRLLGLLVDVAALEAGKLPPISRSADGTATVPASRGLYALRLQHAGGIVTGITRRTPTDHILAPGGALLQALACLPATKAALAPVVLALHDPCIPVQLHLPQTETARA